METKTAAELVALVVREIREHPEYDHIAGVSVMPRIPQPSHPANWRVELSVSGSWHIGQDLFLSGQIMGERIVKLVGSGKVSQLGVADWTRGGQTVRVRREITVSLPVAVCRDEIRAKLVEAIAEIRGDYRSTIALEPLVH
jgi:hypothetical protein